MRLLLSFKYIINFITFYQISILLTTDTTLIITGNFMRILRKRKEKINDAAPWVNCSEPHKTRSAPAVVYRGNYYEKIYV